ncbi:MAG: hypothetical protein RLP44_01205 [Aggregatilineales bacterium]
MTIAEIMQQAQALSPQERKELVKLLVDSLEVNDKPPTTVEVHWGKNLISLLDQLDFTDWTDIDIDDPVEWVRHVRRA